MPQNLTGMQYILHWVISGFAVFFTARLIRGFEIKGFMTSLIAALLIGFANAYIWPVLFFLTLPINILTLGLFTLVVNGATLKICAAILPGFEITSWFSAIFGSIVLSIISVVLHYVFI